MMMKIKKLLSALTLLSIGTYVLAQTEEETFRQYLAEVERANIGIQMIPFSHNSKFALSSIHKSEQDMRAKISPMHLAEIDDKGDVYFRTYRERCGVTESLVDMVLTVNDQRVAAIYSCRMEGELPHAVYVVKSPNGRAYVNDQFLSKKYVYVDLRIVKVAFDTEGFAEAQKKKLKPVL